MSSTELRRYLTLLETAWDDEEPEGLDPDTDPEEPDYSHLPSSRIVRQLAPRLAAVAQEVYDAWDQNPETDELNGGGICHLIAEKMANILGEADVPVSTVSSNHEQHVYCIGQFQDGVYEIDIHHSVYERGGGFTWTKLPDVTFDPSDVTIYRLSDDPADIEQYVEEW